MPRLVTLLAMLLASTTFFAKATNFEEGVIVLDDATFDSELANHEFLLVEFYAPWCGQCKKLAPQYEGAAAILKEQNHFIAKVDVTDNKELEDRFAIQSYPTLIWFHNGKQLQYTGGRTTNTIVSWIMKKTGPPSTLIVCEEIVGKMQDATLNLVFFGDFSGSLFKTFEAIGSENEQYVFWHTGGECAIKHGSKSNQLAIFRTFDSSPLHLSENKSQKQIEEWMDKSSLPQVIDFNNKHVEPVFKKGYPSLVLFTNDLTAQYNKVFVEAAKALQGEILFVRSGNKTGIQKRLAQFSLVEPEMLPTIRILHPGNDMKRYIYSQTSVEEISVSSLKTFVDNFNAGKAKRDLKSQPVPEDQVEVYTIVGSTLPIILKDVTKDVFVFYYAPWCKHCEEMAPVWDQLAESFKGDDTMMIAKFNSYDNEIDDVLISKQPTIRLHTRDNKTGTDFSGDAKDIKQLQKFIAEHKTHFAATSSASKTEDL